MLLEKLSNAIGVSGEETAVRKIIIDAIQDHVTDIHIDAVGNLTALKKGTGKSKLKVMIAAHMDEIGLMITGYDNNGLLQFTKVGGVPARILPGLRLKIGKDQLQGVVIWTPIHLNRDQNVKAIKDLRIDIGVNNKKAAEGKVKRGTRATFDSTYAEISETMVRGKAFDDRVGCSLLIDILQGDAYDVDILVAFTVQEEIGLRGAQVAAHRLKPDIALVLEGTTAHDVPNPELDPDSFDSANPVCKVGSGPVLTIMDRSMIAAPKLLNFIRQTADKHDIPYQTKTALGGGTDAGSIHKSNTGIPSAVISMPCRYIHSPTAFLSKEDYANDLKLVQTVLNTITADDVRIE
ncbi:MAG: M42 family metallopeptidase [Phototrophicaceae bacterium]